MLGLKNEFNDMVTKEMNLKFLYKMKLRILYFKSIFSNVLKFEKFKNKNVTGNHQVVLTTASEEKQKIYTM